MNVDKYSARLENEEGLSRTLGMRFISTPEPDTLMAKMAVDDRNKQTFGFLSGGATLALAENVAGVGSMALCDGKMALGINVSGNHVQAMPYGGTVTAYARTFFLRLRNVPSLFAKQYLLCRALSTA